MAGEYFDTRAWMPIELDFERCNWWQRLPDRELYLLLYRDAYAAQSADVPFNYAAFQERLAPAKYSRKQLRAALERGHRDGTLSVLLGAQRRAQGGAQGQITVTVCAFEACNLRAKSQGTGEGTGSGTGKGTGLGQGRAQALSARARETPLKRGVGAPSSNGAAPRRLAGELAAESGMAGPFRRELRRRGLDEQAQAIALRSDAAWLDRALRSTTTGDELEELLRTTADVG